MMNMKRNKEMKAAIAPAEKASKMLAEGFAQLPDALRLKYPTEMTNVGNVPTAKLAVGSFGRQVVMRAAFGQTGESLNDMIMAKKIHDNERDIQQCMEIVNQQLRLMQIVQARLDQDLIHAQVQAPMPLVTAQPVVQPSAPPVTVAIPQRTMLELTVPHLVNETDSQMKAHNIIAVPLGVQVALIKGDLQAGLGAPYTDYIEVEYNGKVGKISRLVVRPVAGNIAPPPALGSVPPPALF